MKTVTTILLAFFIFNGSLRSQTNSDYNLTIGKSFSSYYYLVGDVVKETDEYYYELIAAPNKVALLIMDKELNYIKRTSFGVYATDFRKVLNLNNKSYIISGLKGKKKSLVVGLSTFNEDKKRFNTYEPIASIEAPDFKSNKPIFSFVEVSNNQEYIVCLTDVVDGKKNAASVALVVFDNNFKEVWRKSNIQISTIPGVNISKQVKVDDEGNVYILSKIGHFKDEKYGVDLALDDQTYEYEIHVINGDESDVKKFKVALENQKITGIDFLMLEDGNLEFLGTYLDKIEDQMGVFDLIMMKNGESAISLNQIENFYETQFVNEYGGPFNFSGFRFNVNQIRNNSDGSVTMIAEQYLERVSTYRQYWFGKILVVNFDESGTLVWSKVIPKMQGMNLAKPGEFGLMSYTLIDLPNNKIGFVYNDAREDTDEEDEEEDDEITDDQNEQVEIWYNNSTFPVHPWKTEIVVSTIDSKGNLEREVVGVAGDYGCRITLGTGYVTSEGDIIFTGHFNKDKWLLKLSFE